jgi:hypothetical protein
MGNGASATALITDLTTIRSTNMETAKLSNTRPFSSSIHHV